jgi:hypothetical protein
LSRYRFQSVCLFANTIKKTIIKRDWQRFFPLSRRQKPLTKYLGCRAFFLLRNQHRKVSFRSAMFIVLIRLRINSSMGAIENLCRNFSERVNYCFVSRLESSATLMCSNFHEKGLVEDSIK